MNHTKQTDKTRKIEDIDYFEVEVNPIVEKLVNDFIKKAIPELYSHYVDNDENAAQLLRVQLTALLHQSNESLLGEIEKKVIGRDMKRLPNAPTTNNVIEIQNFMRKQQRKALSDVRKLIEKV